MAKCQMCGKFGQAGRNVSHSLRHTRRRFMPNIQKATLLQKGQTRQMALCTRCLRTYHKVPG